MTDSTWASRTDPRPADLPAPNLNPHLRRHVEWGPPVLTATDAAALRGRWADAFPRAQPLHLEVGPGNGFHLAAMAARHPDRNWLGVEIRYKRVVLCAKKIEAAGATDNARICRYDAWWLDDLFVPGEVAGLYVNHPDPWTKDRHEKKRLMGPFFAAWAARAMAEGASLRLKTDHRPNVERLVAAFDGLPLRVVGRSDDVAANGLPWPEDDDVRTNYQSKFDKRGEPIYAMLAERVAGEAPPLDPGLRAP